MRMLLIDKTKQVVPGHLRKLRKGAGSLTGSQRPQIQGYIRPHPATAGWAKRHVRPHSAL
jgi:hypothetical protein